MNMGNMENKYVKYYFKTKSIEDYRPLRDMSYIQCPWWCTGVSNYCAYITCYLPINEKLETYWDDAYDIEFEIVENITYTGRFIKPEWIK